jgi:N-acetylneuraminic acid mutarotase
MKLTRIFILTAAGCCFLAGAAAQVWTQKASFGGTSRYSAFSFSIGTKGYVGTGNDGITTGNLTQDFWEYDQASNSWTQKATVPGGARYEAVGFSIGNKGYAGTGYSLASDNLTDMYEYDPVSNTWINKAPMPAGRNCAAVFVLGSKAYIVSGDLVGNNSASNDAWEFDPAANTYTQRASMPASIRSRAIAFAIAGRGYVGGGYDNASNLSDFWQYDPATNSWQQKASLPMASRVSVGFAINNRGFYGTGYANASTNAFYEYDPGTDSWMARPNFGGAVRWGASCFVIGIKGYVGGGRDGNSNYPDWWEYSDATLGLQPSL